MAFGGFFVPANLAMIRKGIEKVDVYYQIQFQSNKLIHHQGKIAAGEYTLTGEWNRFSRGSVSPPYLRINSKRGSWTCPGILTRFRNPMGKPFMSP
jgi:hypothetical protein